jgi:DNA repair protein SbcD/Mre11
MVKILHFADLHLGVENYGRPDPTTGLHSRLLDFIRSFDELVEYALKTPVDLVVFAGDAYKSRDPTPTQQREFASRIQRLVSAGVPVFLLLGNHDLPGATGRANTLDIFSTLEVPNVTVGRKIGIHLLSTRSGDIQIVSVPWIVRSHLLTREDYKNRSLTELDEITIDKMGSALKGQFEQLRHDIPTVIVYHGAVQGATYGSERSVLLGHDLSIPASLLRHPLIDYVALGHIHRHQALSAGDGNVPMVYSGSVDRIDFGEERETKGFVVVDVERGQTQWEFVPLKSTRRFVTIDVQATGSNPMEQLTTAVANHQLQDAIARVIIHTTADKNRLMTDEDIRSVLSGAFRIASVVRQVEQTARPRLGSNHQLAQMAPLDALRVYLSVSQVPADRAELLLQHARQLIIGDDTEITA